MPAKLLAAEMLPGTWGMRQANQDAPPAHLAPLAVRACAQNQIHAIVIRNLGGRGPAGNTFGPKSRAWLASLELPVGERETLPRRGVPRRDSLYRVGELLVA